MTILNERIKKLRKFLDLTQQEFAEKIGTARNNIAGYETGKRSPSEAVISLICKTFNVSEKWLRTGVGEMFIPAPSDALDAFIRERGLSPSDRVLIDKFAALDAGSRQAVVDYVLSVADTIQPPAAPVPPETNASDRPALDIAAEVAALKRQNQELAAEIAAMKEEDIALGLWGGLSASPSASAGNRNPAESAKK